MPGQTIVADGKERKMPLYKVIFFGCSPQPKGEHVEYMQDGECLGWQVDEYCDYKQEQSVMSCVSE